MFVRSDSPQPSLLTHRFRLFETSRLKSTEILISSYKPNGAVVIDPETETMLEVRVFNTGSETETFSLQINSDATSPVSLMLESASSVSVAADASAVGR